jgi:twitching motility protein PilT
MAQLDRFLSVLVSNRASSMTLVEGDVVNLMIAGAPRPITKQVITAPQLVMLLREIADEEVSAQLAAGAPVHFRYATNDGVFAVRTTRDDGTWKATFAIDPKGEFERQTGTYRSMPTPPESIAAVRSGATEQAGSEGQRLSAALAADGTTALPPLRASVAARVEARLTTGMTRQEAARAEMDRMLQLLVARGGSDLHLRCEEPPILRLHGEMIRLDEQGLIENDALEAMLHAIMPDRNRHEFAESNDTDYAYEIKDLARFRCNASRERKGAAAVFRVIPAQVVTVEQLGISAEVQQLCFLTKGLVLVTGPTGSGKSTTLCALVDLVNRERTDHVITIEDPIEFVHPNKNCIITQRQVGIHTSSFKSALRAALREDPDIILVGELRDLETVSIAIETAETGHLVFGTLHTTTAPGTIDRIIDQFPADRQAQIRTMLAESLKGVISQTLCKKIGGGRAAAREILLAVPAVSNLIREGKVFQIPSVMQTSRKLGMVTLNDALMELVESKQVEPREAYMKAVEKVVLVNQLKARGYDTSYAEVDKTLGGGPGMAQGAAPAQAKPTTGKPAPARR